MERQSRRHTILQLIVESYIENAQPVSSTMVATRRPAVNLSPASIRTAMAELERDGFLAQPHTSAGRVPTERGLRAYLDHLVSHKLRPWDRSRLEATGRDGAAESYVNQLGQTLSTLAG
ncbi:MAG: heat-inducible transcriptional repressor HrcA, partial [Deltaproteobacteria bacterium]